MIRMKVLRHATLLCASCLFSACSSVADLENKPASIEYTSTKAPPELAGCITQKWSQHAAPIETQLREKGGVVVSVRNEATGGGVIGSAVIAETAEGSHLRYAELDFSVGTGWISDAVSSCK